MAFTLKPYLPRSLFGRAALILIAPVVVLQLIVSVVFIQRHYERVTVQMTNAALRDITVVLRRVNNSDLETASISADLQIGVSPAKPAAIPETDLRNWFDLSAGMVIRTLHQNLAGLIAVDLKSSERKVTIYVQGDAGPLKVQIMRDRFSAANPHQLLVLMVIAGILMTLIAFVFLRNQLTPITRLAAAAAAFGKGENLPYTPRGATEVREAGHAFLAMRARIERQMESRTLMLSGISHDLRSPMTRLKLGLALLPENEDIDALLHDIKDMERLVDEFLSFVRGDAMEEAVMTDPADLLRTAAADSVRAGRAVKILRMDDCPPIALRPMAIMRALDNLISNAVRYGTRAEISLHMTPESVRFVIDDDGPGIASVDRAQAVEPFARLDAARNPNQGGGVGLGLAIATDIARSHGGALTLSVAPELGGLRAELRIAR